MPDVFIVSKLAHFWGVVHYGVILSRCPAASDAIGVAIRIAAQASRTDSAAQVLVENEQGNRRVVWDSRSDGFTEA